MGLFLFVFVGSGCQQQPGEPGHEAPQEANATPACAPGWGSCADGDDGLCQTHLSTDRAHCGTCGVSCSQKESCVQGACRDAVVQLAAGNKHYCALHQSGRVSCWGANNGGQLGTGEGSDWAQPVWVPGLEDAIEIEASFDATCVVQQDRRVSC